MTLLQNVKVVWSGVAGLDGFSNFYFLGGTSTAAPVASIKVFFEAIKNYVPTTLTFNYPSSGNVIEDSDGSLQGGWSGSPVSSTTGTGVSTYSSTSGPLVEWRGMGVIDSHRPVGKTFLIPATTATIASGVVSSTVVTAITTAATALITATTPNYVIWHRPRKTKQAPHVVTRVGGNMQITSASVPSKIAVLTSRRD